MRTIVTLFLVLIFLSASCLTFANATSSLVVLTEDSWEVKTPMQVARGGLGVAVVNGKIYAIGGSTESGITPDNLGADYKAKGWIVGTNEEYDPATDTWIFKMPMPTPRYNFAIVAYQNKIYCIGGASNFQPPRTILSGVNEVYDPSTDTWETKASLPIPRSGLQANLVNGKIYLIGGLPNGTLNEVYDPATDTWSMKTSMPTKASYYASSVFDDKIYVIGGYGSGKLTQVYDPKTDVWSRGSNSSLSVTDGAAGATDGVMASKRIYVLGVLNFLYQDAPPNRIYNPKIDAWTLGAAVPTNRLRFGVAVVNDKLYAIGGTVRKYEPLGDVIYTATPSAVNEQYTPIGYGTPDPSYVPPNESNPLEITIVSPANQSYNVSRVSLTFMVNKLVNWTGYSLDGEENVTITSNTTLTELSNGSHNVTVYANDAFGNTGKSETVSFAIATEIEPFPALLVAVASAASVVIVSVVFLVYFRKRKRQD